VTRDTSVRKRTAPTRKRTAPTRKRTAPVGKRTVCRTAAQARAFGARLVHLLTPGKILALTGELGAGKTTLVQGLARGLGVLEPKQVVSPSYTLVNEYPTKTGTLIHIDLYRLENPAQIEALGLDDYLTRDCAFIVIEWAERMRTLLDEDVLWVQITRGRSGRIFSLDSRGPKI
jgi:tRNA threonylcarbamoyladenosine biosynthesis protein TsaE